MMNVSVTHGFFFFYLGHCSPQKRNRMMWWGGVSGVSFVLVFEYYFPFFLSSSPKTYRVNPGNWQVGHSLLDLTNNAFTFKKKSLTRHFKIYPPSRHHSSSVQSYSASISLAHPCGTKYYGIYRRKCVGRGTTPSHEFGDAHARAQDSRTDKVSGLFGEIVPSGGS